MQRQKHCLGTAKLAAGSSLQRSHGRQGAMPPPPTCSSREAAAERRGAAPGAPRCCCGGPPAGRSAPLVRGDPNHGPAVSAAAGRCAAAAVGPAAAEELRPGGAPGMRCRGGGAACEVLAVGDSRSRNLLAAGGDESGCNSVQCSAVWEVCLRARTAALVDGRELAGAQALVAQSATERPSASLCCLRSARRAGAPTYQAPAAARC